VTPLAVDKASVARNFSSAARSYDRWASAQARIASELVSRLPAGFAPRSIADLGCGTGLLSARLLERFPGASLVGIDLSEGMVERCRARRIGDGRARFAAGDAEDPAALPRGADLIASSCAVQWFSDLPAALRAWAGALAPGGILAVAALVRGSFPELEAAHAEAFGTPFPGLSFPGEAAVAGPVAGAGLRIRVLETADFASTHADPREAIRSFRKIGARIPGRAPMAPGELRRLLDAMARLAGGGPVTLTHRATVLVAEKEAACAACS
jgi:malonyl-CoA O-methyltransferase